MIPTQDWQEYEYQENRKALREQCEEYKRKATQGCDEHKHIRLCKIAKCETLGGPKQIDYSKIDGTQVANRVRYTLPIDLRRRIAKFYNEMYYYVPKHPSRLLNAIIYEHSLVYSTFLVNCAMVLPTYDCTRGYCGSCGEPCINASYFYWGYARLKPLRTNKYGLVLMRVCCTCSQNGFSIDEEGRKVWLYDFVGTFRSFTSYPFVLCN
jgi:hypothetical protein